MERLEIEMGFRAGFPRAGNIDRGGDHRICKFGSKRIGFDKVFTKVLARSRNPGIQALEPNLRTPNPSPGLQTQESKPRNPNPGIQTQESKRRNLNLGIQTQESEPIFYY